MELTVLAAAVADKKRAQTPTSTPAVRNSKFEFDPAAYRELLYVTVREAMALAAILSSEYKFKVLSLNSKGHKYLIMVDLARHQAQQVDRLLEIEHHIVQSAQEQHGIEVTALYWRVDAHLAADGAPAGTASAAAPVPPRVVPTLQAAQQSTWPPGTALDDELEAFKRGKQSPQLEKGRQQAAEGGDLPPPPNFADTEFLGEENNAQAQAPDATHHFAHTQFLSETPGGHEYEHAQEAPSKTAPHFAYTQFLPSPSTRHKR